MPGLHNLFQPPRACLLSQQEDGDGWRAVLQVDGLLCHSLCVRRVREALRRMEGVEDVRFLPGPDRFILRGRGDPMRPEILTATALHPVLFPRLREALGWAGRALSRLAPRRRQGAGR